MKARTVLLVVIVVTVLMAASASAHSDARATAAQGVMSGGQYVLTSRAVAASQPAGYRLLDAAASVDLATGCCCKSYLPCVRR